MDLKLICGKKNNEKNILRKLNILKEPEPKKTNYCIFNEFVRLHISTDIILDNIIKILVDVEKSSIDDVLMRYIYKLKIHRNLIKCHRAKQMICQYRNAEKMILAYDKCFEKCDKIINRLNKYNSECGEKVKTEFTKIKANDMNNIHEKTRSRLAYLATNGGDCCGV